MERAVKNKYTVRFNSKSLIDMFGGPAAVYRIFAESGSNITQRTVEQWRYRNNMPADAVATIILHAAYSGIDVELFEHLLEKK